MTRNVIFFKIESHRCNIFQIIIGFYEIILKVSGINIIYSYVEMTLFFHLKPYQGRSTDFFVRIFIVT